MATRKARAIHERRRQSDEERFERIRECIRKGELTSVASDSKWQKALSVLSDCCDTNATVLVKVIDREEPVECPGLLNGMFETTWLEFLHGTFVYRELEWIRVAATRDPAFSFAVDYGFENGVVTLRGYQRA